MLAQAMVTLGETLRMRTSAEGLEAEAHGGTRRSLGGEFRPGYRFTPPLDAAEYWPLLLARGVRTPRSTDRRRDARVRVS